MPHHHQAFGNLLHDFLNATHTWVIELTAQEEFHGVNQSNISLIIDNKFIGYPRSCIQEVV
jgi:hypothetical protein